VLFTGSHEDVGSHRESSQVRIYIVTAVTQVLLKSGIIISVVGKSKGGLLAMLRIVVEFIVCLYVLNHLISLL